MTQVTLTMDFPDTFSEADIETAIFGLTKHLHPVGHKTPSLNRSSVFDKIRTWAKVKGILSKGDPKTQTLKLVEEVGELSKAVIRRDRPEIIDAIGDCVVVLTNLAALEDLKIEDCIATAYAVIANRTGTMQNGDFIKDK